MFDVIANSGHLSDFVANGKAIVDEAKISTNGDLGMMAVDPANVAMLDQTLSSDAFEHWESDGPLLGVNLSRMNDVMGMSGDAEAPTHFEFDPETRKLHIDVDGLEYTLALIDPDSIRQEPELPDLDLPVTAEIEWKRMSQSITAADMVSDHIAIGYDINENHLYAEAEGDTDDVFHEHGPDDLEHVEANGDAHSLFSLDYMKDINKMIPKDATATVRVGEGFPIIISWTFADGYGEGTTLVAPRIQSD